MSSEPFSPGNHPKLLPWPDEYHVTGCVAFKGKQTIRPPNTATLQDEEVSKVLQANTGSAVARRAARLLFNWYTQSMLPLERPVLITIMVEASLQTS